MNSVVENQNGTNRGRANLKNNGTVMGRNENFGKVIRILEFMTSLIKTKQKLMTQDIGSYLKWHIKIGGQRAF